MSRQVIRKFICGDVWIGWLRNSRPKFGVTPTTEIIWILYFTESKKVWMFIFGFAYAFQLKLLKHLDDVQSMVLRDIAQFSPNIPTVSIRHLILYNN